MTPFNLEQALANVSATRNRPKKTKSQKTWYKVFDDLYGDRLKNGEPFESVLNEVISINESWNKTKQTGIE
jgi:hypothetical protein